MIVERDVEVPMRDGVVLRAHVFRPDAPGRYPALLMRTPYGKPEEGFIRHVRAGYVVVTMDTRGRYASDGDYVIFSVEHTGDAEDGYDSVEWLAQQTFCDGKIGTIGGSYRAWTQWQTAKMRPPHLVAMCAYSIPLELTDVDWWGGLRPGRRVKWWFTTMAPDLRKRAGWPPPHTTEEALQLWPREEATWLGFLPWIELPRFLPPGLAEYAEDWLRHPNRRPWRYDEIHQEVGVPNLDFSGWYDHCGGSMRHLQLMQRNARTEVARTQTKLVLGPWSHSSLGQRQSGEVDFGPEAEVDLDDLTIRWFDHWLKGLDNEVENTPAVRYFVMGSRRWRQADTWPPEGLDESVLYLDRGAEGSGSLGDNEPANSGPDTYEYDPRDPVPTLWTDQLFTVPADRRRVAHRQDILRYMTEPLADEMEVTGYPEVVLYASTSAPDTDWFARLVDVHPDGPHLEVCYGMVRARHRHSLDLEELVTPGEVVEYHIPLGATACRFKRGHRIGLEITSSDFPNHDRNHNVGRNDLADTQLAVAEQAVYHDRARPSRLILGVRED